MDVPVKQTELQTFADVLGGTFCVRNTREVFACRPRARTVKEHSFRRQACATSAMPTLSPNPWFVGVSRVAGAAAVYRNGIGPLREILLKKERKQMPSFGQH